MENNNIGKEVHLKSQLIRIGDLINMDGPMLVLFLNAYTFDFYLFDWVDNDTKYNRWLIYNVNKKDLVRFVRKEISYKMLFEKNISSVYFTDIDSEDFKSYKIFELKDIPFEYKPDKDVYFDINDAKNFDKILAVLNLDNDLNEIDYSRLYQTINNNMVYQPLLQNNSYKFPKNSVANRLNNRIQKYFNYTQPDVSESNRLPQQKGLVLQPR